MKRIYIFKGGLDMTYKQIEAAREARLWIGQIFVPTLTLIGTTLAIPEVRQAVAAKATEVKTSIENRMKKKTNES